MIGRLRGELLEIEGAMVVVDAGGAPENVEDGVDGFLIRPADTFTLAELLLQVFNGQVQVAQMGENARQKVLNLFDSEKMLDQTLLAYAQARLRFVTAHRPLFSLARPQPSQ